MVKGGGDNFTSFDELESVESSQIRQKELEVKQTVDAIEKVKGGKKDAKTTSKETTKKATEQVSDEKQKVQDVADKVAKKQSKKDDTTEADEGENTNQTEGESTELPEVKTYKIKSGHEELELRADTLIPTLIDGKEEQVTLEDLRSDYSGRKVITQRFQQLSDERREFDTNRAEVDTFIKDVFTDIEADPFSSVLKIAERAGLDPVKYRLDLMDSLAGHAEKWSQMTDEQRQAYKVQIENEQLKNKLQKTETQTQHEHSMRELDAKVSQVQEKLGITRDQFVDMYYNIQDHFQKNGINQEITPELVAEYFVDGHNEAVAVGILKELDPELSQDWEAVNTLIEVAAENPDFDEEDLMEVAREVWGSRKAEKVSKKLAQGKPDMVKSSRPNDPQKTPLSFDELETMF